MKRFDPSAGSSLLTLAVIATVGVLLSIVTVVPRGATRGTSVGVGGGAAGADTGADGAGGIGGDAGSGGGSEQQAGTKGQSGSGSGATGQASSGANGAKAVATSCAGGKNGGPTDVGVTGNNIKLAATVVDDGPGASFLAQVRIGMQAVLNQVNRGGGICGRQLTLLLRNDSWEAQRGQTFIQNFVESEKVFALAVVPSSEGLDSADDYIKSKGVPVVGTDGMLKRQYLNPWIWPVATPTISTMHIMAKEAHDRGARRFGIVFDAKYHFGVEGAFAYNQAVKRLTNHDIQGFRSDLKNCIDLFCGIQPNKPSYANEAKGFDDACYGGGACDFVAYLLEPDTARTFMRDEPRQNNPIYGMGGAQPLFNSRFSDGCKQLCETMRVWTGYLPPIEEFAARPALVKYVNDVKSVSSTVDAANQFLEGGYVGMTLLVQALQKVGPNLTRANLKQTLDSMQFDSGMANPMKWSSGNHFANTSAHAFQIVPGGWRTATPLLADPWAGQDTKSD